MAARTFDPQRDRFWREVFARYRASGLSVRAFCVQAGLSEPSFYAWRRTLAQRDDAPRVNPSTGDDTLADVAKIGRAGRGKRPGAQPPDFVPLKLSGEVRSPALSGMAIELRGGRVLRLPETLPLARVVELVRALEGHEATS
jgi:hypothetical protein